MIGGDAEAPVQLAPDPAKAIGVACDGEEHRHVFDRSGNLGGLIGPIVVGIAVDRWQSWTFPFYVTALVYAAGAIAWLAIDPDQRLTGS